MKFKFLACLSIFLLSSFFFMPKDLNGDCKNFYLVTIPKSGSHLLIKLLVILTEKYPNGFSNIFKELDKVTDDEFEETLLSFQKTNHFGFNHLGRYGELFSRFSEKHPEYVRILVIRNLKDLLLSYTFHINKSLEEQFGENPLNEKIKFVLDLNSGVSVEIKKDIEIAIEWMKRSDVQVYRFEDIIGEKGNGCALSQKNEVCRLANQLGIEITASKLEDIENKLWGNSSGPAVSGTFRTGKIGEWKKYYTEEHNKLFDKYWLELNKKLGY